MRRYFALLLILALAGCNSHSEPAPPPGPRVESESVTFPAGSPYLSSLSSVVIKRAPMPPLQVNGRLVWNEDRTVRVYTPFAGRVERILAQPGDAIRKGQALATVASPDFGQAQADARRAEADYGLSVKNLERLRELDQAGVVAKKDVQVSEAEHERAQAERARTHARLALYGSAGRGVDQVYALASPIAGTLVEKNINPGQELRPDQMTSNAPPLFVVTDPTTLWVLLDAAENNLAHLKPGKSISVRVPAYPDEAFPAKIISVTDFLDPATRTIKVRAAVANPAHQLKAEMFVTAEAGTEGLQALQVPEKSVYFQAGKHYLFVDEGGGKYSRHEVRIGEIHNGQVHIVDGLKDGERVVTDGSLFLQQMLQPRRVQK
jgi:cobalt-zinc-cadmium efflux system membrane fusion protein